MGLEVGSGRAGADRGCAATACRWAGVPGGARGRRRHRRGRGGRACAWGRLAGRGSGRGRTGADAVEESRPRDGAAAGRAITAHSRIMTRLGPEFRRTGIRGGVFVDGVGERTRTVGSRSRAENARRTRRFGRSDAGRRCGRREERVAVPLGRRAGAEVREDLPFEAEVVQPVRHAMADGELEAAENPSQLAQHSLLL